MLDEVDCETLLEPLPEEEPVVLALLGSGQHRSVEVAPERTVSPSREPKTSGTKMPVLSLTAFPTSCPMVAIHGGG